MMSFISKSSIIYDFDKITKRGNHNSFKNSGNLLGLEVFINIISDKYKTLIYYF